MATRAFQLLTVLVLCGGHLAFASDRSPQGIPAEAVKVARESVARLSLGRLTAEDRGRGGLRIRAEVLFNGLVVARLRVDPQTGGFLPEGERLETRGESLDLAALRAAVNQALRRLEVGDWTWPTEHGRAWGVPLKYQGRVVGTLKCDPQKGPLPRERDDD